MPHCGPYRTTSIFLADRQANKFPNPSATGVSVTDKEGVVREIFTGKIDSDEEHYGLFEGRNLIASLWLDSPALAGTDCPSDYWSIGMIEVVDEHQGKGLAPCLYDAVFKMHGRPLASDLDQDGGGADLWKRWVRDYPGDIELHGPGGLLLGTVVALDGRYLPDPCAVRATRLVRVR